MLVPKGRKNNNKKSFSLSSICVYVCVLTSAHFYSFARGDNLNSWGQKKDSSISGCWDGANWWVLLFKKKYLSSILFPISLFIFRRFNVFYVHTLRVINTWHLLWILFFVAILCCTFHFNPTSRPVFFCCARKKKYSFKHSTNDTQNMVSFLSCSLHHIFAIIFVYVNLKNKKTRSRVEKQEIMKWKKTTKIHIHCARAMIDTYFNFVFHFDFLVSRILGCTVQHLTFRHD